MNNLYMIRNSLAEGKSIFDLPLRVTYYARVSTDTKEQLKSLKNQIMYFEDYIKENNNWLFVPGYIDEGLSGTSVNKRKNFLRMINDAKNGMFDLILTKEISRFSRNTINSIQYTQELLSYGVGIFFLNDNLNTFDADSELRLTIMSSIAQEEVRRLSERVRFGCNRMIEKGVVAGSSNILGYKKDNGKLVIVPEEANVVRIIFNEYSKNLMGTQKLGHYLFEKYGIKSTTGKPIAPNVLLKIIRNPKYKGFYSAKLDTKIDYQSNKRIKINEEDRVVYKDNESCPPIVSEELWDECNKILKINCAKFSSGAKESRYALSGKIKCFHDGATFVRGKRHSKKTGEEFVYWGCSNYRKYGKAKSKGCATPMLQYDELYVIFKKMLDCFIDNKNEIVNEIYELVKSTKSTTNFEKEIKELDTKINAINDMKMQLIDMRAKKEINFVEFSQLKEKYDKDINMLENAKHEYIIKGNVNNYDINIKEFVKKISNIVYSDKESVFNIAGTLIDKIFVEKISNDEEDKRVVLHIKLNVLGCSSDSLKLNDFLLLFCDSKECCY